MADWTIQLESQSVEETLAIGRAIGGAAAPGDVVGLIGCLGAGKTHLAKGVAVGLGVPDDREVNSPTFVLVNEYEGRLHIYHVDAYRLTSPDELEALGFAEMCEAAGVVLVEWADRVMEALGPDALWIELSVTAETGRRLTLRTDSTALARRLDAAGLDRWALTVHKGEA
ncbi:MAG: tRNA (adenosine(37)-N6)-threonylcarbamoyltransferase complex ATPase subunit type 1 TsaE [Planctomycetota bacterium]